MTGPLPFSAYLLTIYPFATHPHRGGRIIAVVAPVWMMEVDDVIAVIGSHAVVESDLANLLPVFDDDPLERREPFAAAPVGGKVSKRSVRFGRGSARSKMCA